MFKAQKTSSFLLAIVLIIYIICNIKTPIDLAKLIDNIIGNIVVVVILHSGYYSTCIDT